MTCASRIKPTTGNASPATTVRLGKISYLNVLPIYYGLEHGHIQHDFVLSSGPPAELNTRMAQGQLDMSAASSIEYARHHRDYLLLPDLAIGSQGPVQSVLLLSRHPLPTLSGQSILISSQTHTSAVLLRLMLREKFGLRPSYETGDITSRLRAGQPPAAFLAIGDEALRLRNHSDFPFHLDLGQAWLEWTGLPFIFGVWIARRQALGRWQSAIRVGSERMLASKQWGMQRLEFFARLISEQGILDRQTLLSYFHGLVFDFGPREQAGLRLFYHKLYQAGEIGEVPELNFVFSPNDRG